MKEAIKMTKEYLDENGDSKVYFEKWKDWKWQLKNTIRKVETVEKILDVQLSKEDKMKIEKTLECFPMAITPYYLSLVEKENIFQDPVFKQCFPDSRELIHTSCDMVDPLNEDKDSPALHITHRYPDRVLFHVSNVCAMYCRHCTRKRKVGDIDSIPERKELLEGIEYIKSNSQIRDVLLSGGDPFLLPTDYLEWIIEKIHEIKHVEVIRIGTRTPVVLPFRIDDELIRMLKKFDNIWINTHFNHPKELTKESKLAIKKLVEIGIPMGNQSVLLRKINDCPQVMKSLVRSLTANRVRPYYLYQCDLSYGLEHFRTNVGKGIEIMENLRGHTSGMCVPTYVIDAPGGGGKIPIMPNYLLSWSTDKVVLRNYEGVITTYTMPSNDEHEGCDGNCKECDLQILDGDLDRSNRIIGISKLLCDYENDFTLIPKQLKTGSEKYE